MTQYFIIIGIAILGMLLGFMYHMLKKIEVSIEKLSDKHDKILVLYNDLDKRIIVLETKAKERRHEFMEEVSNG